jgi:hypothetical protein
MAFFICRTDRERPNYHDTVETSTEAIDQADHMRQRGSETLPFSIATRGDRKTD